jgi:hypothetical protein
MDWILGRLTARKGKNAEHAKRSTFNVQRSTFNAQRSTLNVQRSTFNARLENALWVR